jgi:two-component system chemotaxis sensor kinase CheA
MRDQLAGDAPTGGVELDRNEYESFLADVARGATHKELAATAASWRFEAAGKRMASMRDQIRALAKRLGRAPVDVVIEPTRIRLPPTKWRSFWSAFTHVLRNTVDHGVGTVEERTAAGKRPEARVVLGVVRERDSIVVTVTDDGPGVNWSRIAARAAENGLPHATPADLSNALFADGVSSREEVTSTSGRGVGLSAMREVVESLGGAAEVQSTPGRGTTFRFRLPSSMQVE